jgi:diguanylate cyclase (GGDEF)-like protein
VRAPFPSLPRRLFSSLASRIATFVFAATLASALAVAGTSAYAVRAFLRTRIEARIPEAAARARDRLELWYAQRSLDLDIFAHSEIVVRGVDGLLRGGQDRERAEVEQYLGYVREGLPVYRAIFALDRQGREIALVGRAYALDPASSRRLAEVRELAVSGVLVAGGGERLQIVSAPISAGGSPVASLHAVLELSDLRDQLRSAVDSQNDRIHVFGEKGELVASSADGFSGSLPAPVARADAGSTLDYLASDGVRVVASALPLKRLGWRVVFEGDYGLTFAPIASILKRVFGMNLGIVVVLAGAAFAIARVLLRPLHALSECAIRLRDGETNVELPVVDADHEVAILARSFGEMVESLTRANEALAQLAITDGLTKIHNHRFFRDQLASAIRNAENTGAPLALILIDIDDFKTLNDRHGHATGDAILEGLARLLSLHARPRDVLARYGGEEFALLAPHTDLESAIALAERVRLDVHEQVFAGPGSETPLRVTVSIGVALYRGDPQSFFADADRALYAAKHAGKDCVEVARSA